MKTEEKIVDKVLDTLIDEASAEAYRKEADYNAPEVSFSPEHERNMQKLFKNERRKYNLRRATVVTGKVACLLLVVLVAMSVTIYNVDALRTKFFNFFFVKEAPDTEIRFTETKQNSFSNDMVSIGYIPEGFKITKDKEGINNLFLIFENEAEYIQLKMNNLSLKIAINTEKGTLENIKIKGHEGFYLQKGTETVIFWHDGIYTYRINSSLEKSEIIKIAEYTTAK
ncbi:MAG: DUF4367 domain-containing protein [Clostridia bacterium]|nr:DUF4367 domain-containing protein [Clostridia bacterium]